ncbi:hypothetical protein E2562_031611, partial [Oryza meyeriana var. granulata]
MPTQQLLPEPFLPLLLLPPNGRLHGSIQSSPPPPPRRRRRRRRNRHRPFGAAQ